MITFSSPLNLECKIRKNTRSGRGRVAGARLVAGRRWTGRSGPEVQAHPGTRDVAESARFGGREPDLTT